VTGFVLLGAFFLQKAVRRSAKRSWAWGRVGGGPPLSRKSYAIWGMTFLSIAWVLGQAPEPSTPAVGALGFCFVAMLVAGFMDSAADRVRSSKRETDR